jgi:hypothetical protein
MVSWLEAVSWISIILGFVTAGIISIDLVAHPQKMRIMDIVWPVTGLYFPLIGLWFYHAQIHSSPTHPAYPTGHGTVAGACITVLKFFFNGDFVIPNPQIPSSDGTTLNNYTGSDAGQITVNGEPNKLAHNVSFGHGIDAGIHWRSDTDTSIQLGEAVAISILRDRAHTYNEKFTVKIRKLDGSFATISNQ